MTKTERKKQINSRFYAYIEANYPDYYLHFEEMGGRVYLVPSNNRMLEAIMYHQSEHYVMCDKHCLPSTQDAKDQIQRYLNNNIIPLVDTVEV